MPRAVTKLGPGSLQSWAADAISILREAHQAVEEVRARGDTALDPGQLATLRKCYDEAAAFGITHNRLRDWHDGNHPGYTLGCWLEEYKEQAWLFTRQFTVEWTSNSAERAVKGPKRHQAVSGYWHTQRTLAAGAASAATSTPPGTTACAPSTPSAPHSKENPGYRHSPHWPDARLRATREWTRKNGLAAGGNGNHGDG